jgi:hypothetical protein
MARRSAFVIGVAAVGMIALVAAGCGGDDDEETTTAALGKQEFIAQGDEICAKADKQLDQAGRETLGKGKPSQQEFEQFATENLVPNIQGQIDAVRALGIPEGDEEQINATLDDAQEAVDGLEQDPSQLEDGPAGRQLEQAGNELKQYGFKKCGG